MTMFSQWKYLARMVLLIMPLVCFAQSTGRTPRSLDAVSNIQLDISGLLIVAPVLCGPNQSVLVRLAGAENSGDFVAIPPDGKQIVDFGLHKIPEVTRPRLISAFASDDRVYLLVRTEGELRSRTLIVPGRDGEEKRQAVQVPAELSYFIVRFLPNGTYEGKTRLDLEFVPRQFGVFEDGSFLVGGRTNDQPVEPKLALVASNGQLLRYLFLKNDIASDPEKLKQSAPEPDWRTNIQFTIDLSSIVAAGRELVLARKAASAPIYAVSAGGEVRVVHLQSSERDQLFSLTTTPNFWIAQYIHRLKEGKGVEIIAEAVDPSNGSPIERYSYPTRLGFGLACSTGTEFTFLRTDPDGKVSLVHAVASQGSGSAPDVHRP